jgi:hypothetical protein
MKARLMHFLGLLVSALVTLAIVLTAYVVFFENSLVYFPQKSGVGPSPGEDVFLTTSDGVRVHAWFVATPEAKATLLWFHGNAGNLEHRRDMLEGLRRLPAQVLALDYRGFGKSDGKPDEHGIYRDGRAAYDWLVQTRRVPPERIVLLGESLGGAVASELATQVPVGAVILQSTFTNAADMSRLVLPGFPARWIIRHRFDNVAKVAMIRVPKLFLHARDDEVIPFAMGPRLYEAAAAPKEFHWFEGGGHNGIFILVPDYYPRLAAFIGAQVR